MINWEEKTPERSPRAFHLRNAAVLQDVDRGEGSGEGHCATQRRCQNAERSERNNNNLKLNLNKKLKIII